MMVMSDCYEAPKSQSSTGVIVKNPIIHHSYDNKRYTSYEIAFKSNNICFSLKSSSVRRRYSDFVFLRKLLLYQHPNINPPPLPPRNLFRNRFTIEFIEERRKQLEDFLQQLLQTPIYLSSKAFHLFLQSNLPMTEIEAQASGKVPSIPLMKDKSHILTTNASLSYKTSVVAQCQTYLHVDGESSSVSPRTCSNSLSINNDTEQSSVPVLPCTINRYVVTERAQSFQRLGFSSNNASPCSSFGSTHSLP